MATTDAKSGFRLPWSADRNESDTQADAADIDTSGVDPAQATSELEAPTMTDSPTPGVDVPAEPTPSSSANTVTRKPNKFMADLTKAMQAAAEAARSESLEKFGTEAKTHIESIHASTADEASQLRKKADDDIAGVREWSKTEIARIREETDERIQHRKDVLEREIDAHAAQIEARIERVQQRVSGFESEMSAFFERLLAEEDPTRFAAMAESLPEPPPFDPDSAWEPEPAAAATPTDVWATPEVETAVAVEEPVAEAAPVETVDTPVAEAVAEAPVAEAETPAPDDHIAETAMSGEAATHEAAATNDEQLIGVESSNGFNPWGTTPSAETETATESAVATETGEATEVTDSGDLFGMAADDAAAEPDPRLTALGLDADFAAAEAEAGDFPTETADTGEEIPVIADDALAARLAGLVPDADASAETSSTRVVVTGLVSVASIAGFKRNLARLSGVHSVGVTSGPDGEFVFSVNHDPSMALGEQIASLPGFSARVTNEGPGELTVAARDPEAEG
jgi:hypothetical protein